MQIFYSKMHDKWNLHFLTLEEPPLNFRKKFRCETLPHQPYLDKTLGGLTVPTYYIDNPRGSIRLTWVLRESLYHLHCTQFMLNSHPFPIISGSDIYVHFLRFMSPAFISAWRAQHLPICHLKEVAQWARGNQQKGTDCQKYPNLVEHLVEHGTGLMFKGK